MGWNVILASKMWDVGFHKIGLLNQWPALWRDMGYKTFQTRPPLPSYISPWRQHNFLFRGYEGDGPMSECMRKHELWLRMVWTFELLFTTEVIPSSCWVTQGRKEQTEYPVYHTTTLLQHINWQPETFFKGQRTRFGNTAFHQPPTDWSAAQSKYLLHFPFPNGR